MAKLSAKQERELRQAFRDRARKVKDESRAGKQNNKSLKWFRDQVQGSIESRTKSTPMVGRIYTFAYQAKWRKQLPYYDRFPLSICIAKEPGRWYSINLHYLPPDFRINFLEELLVKFVDDKTKRSLDMRQKSQLDIDWSRIKSFNSAVFEHALTSYLPSQMQTPLKEVDARQWYMAAGLPFQQFVTAKDGKQKRYSAQKVWSEL